MTILDFVCIYIVLIYYISIIYNDIYIFEFKYCTKIQQKNDISKFLRSEMSLKLKK